VELVCWLHTRNITINKDGLELIKLLTQINSSLLNKENAQMSKNPAQMSKNLAQMLQQNAQMNKPSKVLDQVI